MDIGEVTQRFSAWVLSNGAQVLIILILAVIALKISGILSSKLITSFSKTRMDSESQKRVETLGSVIRHIFTVLILIVSAMMIMKEVGIEIGPALAAAGIAGLAVGFGAQNLVKDVISGFFILLEDQIRVGDIVKVAGHGGLVEKVNLRMTILRDLSGNVHYIRNGMIDIVINMTKEYSRYVFEVGVAYREDIDEVVAVLKKIDEEFRADPEFTDVILEPLEILGLDKFADSAIIIKARYKTKTLEQWRVGREFNRRMKMKFDEMNIEIPFPHVTVYPGEDKNGNASPLRILMKDHRENNKQ